MIPGTNGTLFRGISICTSSWTIPSLCELDGLEAPTRILLFVAHEHSSNKTVAELLLNPTSGISSSKPSQSSITNDAAENGHLLVCCGQSVINRSAEETVMSPTRSGYLLPNAYNIQALIHNTILGRIRKFGQIYRFRDTDRTQPRLCVEPYSGAIWYRAGTKFYLHHTD